MDIIIVLVYIDDIFVTAKYHLDKVRSLKTTLSSKFDKKYLGPLKYFIGIDVVGPRKGIFIFQRKYVPNLRSQTSKLIRLQTRRHTHGS